MSPAVTVIIPCYNQAGFLDETIESVLGQTWTDFEIIVVDDGSTDSGTLAILDGLEYPKTTLVRQANKGLAGARNSGIRAGSGTYILPLDADDKIAPTYLEKAVAVLESRPEVGIVYSLARFFGVRDDDWNLPDFRLEDFLFANSIFCTALFRRSDWERAGGYDESLRSWEDYELWMSFLEMGRQVHRIPEVMFFYRQHPESMLRSMSHMERWEKQTTVLAYLMRKHGALYRQHLDAMARRLIPKPEPPRHGTYKFYKYSLLSALYGLVESIPPLASWAARKKSKSLWQRDLAALK